MHRSNYASLSTALCAALVFCGLARPAVALLDYKRDILPIFEAKCFDCHSASAGKVKGGLRLDDPKGFFKRFAKNDVVVPGNWDASYLFVAVSRPPGAKDAMPPKNKGKSLTPEEVMKVAQWIYEGARIDGERGERGEKDDDPEKILKFKDGVMVSDSFDAVVDDDHPEKKAPEKEPEETMRDWFNAEGNKIIAAYKGIEGDKVILLRKDGKTFKYPIAKLSEKSRAELKELAKEKRDEG